MKLLPMLTRKAWPLLTAWCWVTFAVNVSCGSQKGDSLVSPSSSGAALGEACSADHVCAGMLSCSADRVCVPSCLDGGVDHCGQEACMASGECSRGLGQACSGNGECTAPLVCSSDGRCGAPCQASAALSCGGKACRDDGTCPQKDDLMLGGFGGSGSGGTEGTTGGEPACIDVNVDFTPQTPTVLLLIDRSGSMSAGSGFGNAVADAVAGGTYTLGDCPSDNDWRWNVVRDVLLNPDKGVVKPLEGAVRFGLSLYTSDNGQVKDGSPEEVDTTKQCPQLIDVPIALNNHAAMLAQFKCNDIANDTPTGESLLAAANTLKAFAEPGPKLIVLATDGEPDSCECPNFSGNAAPAKCKQPGMAAQVKADVVATAAKIHDEDDITIHVINVSTPSNAGLQTHLGEVAASGGGSVYPGFSPGALRDAFGQIIDGARSCVIDLNGEIAKGMAGTGAIHLDGQSLALDDANGWRVNTPSQIELLGDACEAIKSGQHDLDIKFPCGAFKPPH